MLRQIVYESRVAPAAAPVDMRSLLARAQQLNAIDGVTGLLYADNERFLQVLEGPEESVKLTYGRIEQDVRHHDIVKLVDQAISAREFGDWTMADRTTRHERDVFDVRMRTALVETSDRTRSWFDRMTEPA